MHREDEQREMPREGIDPLCPECGHAFGRYVDRLLDDGPGENKPTVCPVCGCGECPVAKP